ncbi:hypothetical protein pipiens_005388 [Culex pipiens pipiens]|uniref:Uncharacterized protein n=1 Tax=Culex pipiens pipiens TaxID=38569 RepID=A0ABD1DX80_CULPP
MKIIVTLALCLSFVAITLASPAPQSMTTSDVSVLQNAEVTLEAADTALTAAANANVTGLSQALKTSLDAAVKNLNTQISKMSPLLFQIALFGNSATSTKSLKTISASINGSINTIQSVLAKVG